MPSMLVVATYEAPLGFVKRTEALGIPAPEGSLTIPVNPPVGPLVGTVAWPVVPLAGSCAGKLSAKNTRRKKHKKNVLAVRNSRKLIKSPDSAGLCSNCFPISTGSLLPRPTRHPSSKAKGLRKHCYLAKLAG